LPYMLTNFFNVDNSSAAGEIPYNVKLSFYIGAAAFILCVLYTVLTSKEYPPMDMTKREKVKESRRGLGAGASEILFAIRNMPDRMKQLALVQFLTWPGLFLMWFYYTPAVGSAVFGGEPGTDLYKEGAEFAGLTFSVQNLVTFLFAMALPFMASKIGNKYTHMVCLLFGSVGLLSFGFIQGPESKYLLYGVMACVGIAWASILSMPYSMLSGCLPDDKIGIYMGIFNFFIVLPEIIASLFFGPVMEHILGNNKVYAVMVGGVLLFAAALLTIRIKEDDKVLTPID